MPRDGGGGGFALFAAVSAAAHGLLFLLPAWNAPEVQARSITLAAALRPAAAPPGVAPRPAPNLPAMNPELSPAEVPPAESPPAPAAEALPEYEVGALSGPKINGRFSPAYPFKLKKLGREGRVVLRLLIDETGRLVEREVVQSAAPEFLAAVERELAGARFTPALNGGRPVKCLAVLPVTFRLER